jgi:hypothetical protein
LLVGEVFSHLKSIASVLTGCRFDRDESATGEIEFFSIRLGGLNQYAQRIQQAALLPVVVDELTC